MTIKFDDLTYGELHGHSDGSLLDGVGSAREHVKSSLEFGHCGCGLTDHGTMRNCLNLYDAGKKLGQKIIMGMEAYCTVSLQDKGYFHNTLLAINEVGYKNLCMLRSISSHKDHLSSFPIRPRNTYEEIFKHSEGLVATSGCIASIVSRKIANDELEEAEKWLLRFKEVFQDRFFIEIHLAVVNTEWNSKTRTHNPIGYNTQEKINIELLRLSKKLNIKAYFVQDSHLPNEDYYNVQKMMMTNNKSNNGWYFDKPHPKMSVVQMYEHVKKEMSYIDDNLFVELVNNTKIVYDMTDYSNLIFEKQLVNIKHEKHQFWNSEIKNYSHPKWQELIRLSKDNKDLELALKIISSKNKMVDKDEYFERLFEEIQVIEFNGAYKLLAYFFPIESVANFLVSKNKLIAFGRGSGASSLYCYLIGISLVDPVKYGLLFERFLTIERVLSGSFPDFDFDCEDRGEIISFLINEYGKDYVALIATITYIQIKSCVKDVCRAEAPELSPTQLNYITNEIEKLEKDGSLEHLANSSNMMKFEYILDHVHELKKLIKEKPYLKNTFLKSLGTIKATSIHAGGVIIGNNPLKETIPLDWNEKEQCYVSEYEMNMVEYSGLIKYDYLKIDTLHQIRVTLDRIQKSQSKKLGIPQSRIRLEDIPLDDLNVLNEFRLGKTTSIFQFDTDVANSILTKCNKIDDLMILVAITALGRPGPLKNGAHLEFIKRINDPKNIIYKHPDLEPILKDSYGLIIYQEDIQKIVQKMGGFGKHDSSVLLKAFSKKTKDKILTFKETFLQGCLKNNYSEKLGLSLWDEMESFGSYGFNKSHSVSYVLLSYVMMYLKYYYPHEYKMSILELSKKEDTQRYMLDWGEEVSKPDINHSGMEYELINVNDKITIQMPLTAINGLNDDTCSIVLQNRPYKDYEDFIQKVKGSVGKGKCVKKIEDDEEEKEELGKINKTSLLKLVYSGALDSLIGGESKRRDIAYDIELKNPKTYTKKDKALYLQMNPQLTDEEKKSGWKKYKEGLETKRLNLIKGMSYGELITKELELLNFSNFDYFHNFKDIGKKKTLPVWGLLPQHIKEITQYNNNDNVAILAGFFDPSEFNVKNPQSKIFKRNMMTFTLRIGESQLKVVVFPDSLDKEKEQKKKFGFSGLLDAKEFNPVVVKGKITYNQQTKELTLIYESIIIL